MSDHGFKWGADRPSSSSSIQFDTAFLWHESPGILAAAGPAFPAAAARGKAGVFDVTPTLCRLLGLPADPAFEGRPVSGLAAGRLPAAPAAVSWTKTFKVERLAVRASSDADKKAGEEFTKKLISLGYLTGAEAAAVDARPPERAGTETAGTFQNIATFLRARGQVPGSASVVPQGARGQPEGADGALQLLGRAPDARPLGRVGRRPRRRRAERLPRPGGRGLPAGGVVRGTRREGSEDRVCSS